MKQIYESFEEIADDFCNGGNISHQSSGHSSGICLLWMKSIREFAKALDLAKVPLPKDEKIYERFWDNVWKALDKWEGGLGKQEMSKSLGKISQKDARVRFKDKKLKRGMKVYCPKFGFDGYSNNYYEIK